MEPVAQQLIMYGQPSDAEPLDWAWVHEQLAAAGTYWVVTPGTGHPHPRPVWGVWSGRRLHLSIGSPTLVRALEPGGLVTVHLGSATDVVVLEGVASGTTADADLLGVYNEKYDWSYSVDEYGPLTSIVASTVIAWCSAGWAGRDGFQATGRWHIPTPDVGPGDRAL